MFVEYFNVVCVIILYSKFDEYGHEDKEDVPPPLHRLLPIIVVEDKQRDPQPTSDVVDNTQPAIYKFSSKGTKRKKDVLVASNGFTFTQS